MENQYRIALVGNPNCGKTTLFNELTGAKHTVGNWPGVTVEQKSGKMKIKEKENVDIEIIDLPGTYSLNAYSLEETITRDYILEGQADLVINILDVSNLERNLYLTVQLQEMNIPMVVVLNMMDIAERKGYKLDVSKLSKTLGLPIYPISASKGVGIEDLKLNLFDLLLDPSQAMPQNTLYYSEATEELIRKGQIDFKATTASARCLLIKNLEGDWETLQYFGVKAQKSLENVSIKEERYEMIKGLVEKVTIDAGSIKEKFSDRVDEFLLHPIWGLGIFALMMYIVFNLTFSLGDAIKEPMVLGIECFGEFVRNLLLVAKGPDWFVSLMVDGIINGVGGVITFLPNIAILFLALSLLEESGYMTRAAFLMDKYMQKIGLSGKAFIPLIMGFGCSVPAIMGTRIMEDEKDKLTAMLIIPFMSCGARMPIYVLFASLFFPGNEAIITFSLYWLGIMVAVLMGSIARSTFFRGEDLPYIMELPTYRLPSIKGTGISVWQRIKDYITKAGTLIFAASVLVWFILNFNMTGRVELADSWGYYIGEVVAPIFAPMGFGTWQASLSLITGLVAKEVVVANMNIFYGAGGNITQAASVIQQAFTAISAYAFMVFALLYTPCIATIGIIKKESKSWKFTGFVVLYQIAIAWIFSFVMYQLSIRVGIGEAYGILMLGLIVAVVGIVRYKSKKLTS